MEITIDMKALEDDVLRKIGRNMMGLQQIEALLKTLLIHSNVRAGPAEVLQQQQARRNEAIAKQTLGTLVKQFTSEVLAPEDVIASDSAGEGMAPYFTFSYSIQTDEATITQRTAALKLLVDERNELIHHFLPKWTRGSLESTHAVNLHLDQQHARVRAEFEILRAYLEGLRRSRDLLRNLMFSPEYEKQMEMLWLQNSPVVQLLVEMSRNVGGADGWVRLDAAGQELWRAAQDEMASLHERYGYSKLKPLLVASGLFDLMDKPLANGGSAASFRLNDKAIARHSAGG